VTQHTKKALNMPSNRLCKHCDRPLKVKKYKTPFRVRKELVITLNCECEIERQKLSELSNRKQEIMHMLHNRGFQDGKYAHMTFNTWQRLNIGVIKMAADYIDSVNLDGRNWLYLHGDCGLGKTHIAVASVRRITLTRQWQPALFRWTDYCGQIQQSWRDTSIKVNWNLIRNAGVLVLDDIDKKTATQWALEQLFDVIDYRDINNLPTIITANRNILELSAFWSKTRETEGLSRAIISRIVGQLYKIIFFEGKDYRLKK
jgi:DNA replication protein DnaC